MSDKKSLKSKRDKDNLEETEKKFEDGKEELKVETNDQSGPETEPVEETSNEKSLEDAIESKNESELDEKKESNEKPLEDAIESKNESELDEKKESKESPTEKNSDTSLTKNKENDDKFVFSDEESEKNEGESLPKERDSNKSVFGEVKKSENEEEKVGESESNQSVFGGSEIKNSEIKEEEKGGESEEENAEFSGEEEEELEGESESESNNKNQSSMSSDHSKSPGKEENISPASSKISIIKINSKMGEGSTSEASLTGTELSQMISSKGSLRTGDEFEWSDGEGYSVSNFGRYGYEEEGEGWRENEDEDFYNEGNLGPSDSELELIQRSQKILEKNADLSSDAESSEGSDQEEENEKFPPEYSQIQRLIKYTKAGNPTATIIALSSLRDYNMGEPYVQAAIKESQGLEVLLNILETDENRCKISSLLILREITLSHNISQSVYNLRGVETLINVLKDPAKELKILAANVLSNVTKIRKARRIMRKGDGISLLVDMLDIDLPANLSNSPDINEYEVQRSGAIALWSAAKSTKNKDSIRKSGAIPLLVRLIKTNNIALIIPVIGILHECATEPNFRLAIRTEGLLEEFNAGLKSSNYQLVQLSASAICHCAEDPISREKIYSLGAIEQLVEILKNPNVHSDKELLEAVTGAIWKCSPSIAKDEKFLKKELLELLVPLLSQENEVVQINVAGALYEIVHNNPSTTVLVADAGAIPPLIKLLKTNNPKLLVNVAKALGELSQNNEARIGLDEHYGFRLIWSLLKHPSPEVVESAALAICPYVENTPDSGEIVRSLVGGLEVLVQLLNSVEIKVQAAVAQAIAVIAKYQENLAIMSDLKVVEKLARLTQTNNDLLRRSLAEAIANCCNWKTNATEFGQMRAVSPICCYLTSEDPLVHTAAGRALWALSSDPRNCITMHQNGVVPYMLNMIGSTDPDLQNAAAGVLYNIRKLALNTEKARLR